ncbi:MAG: fluoride efflux transporter CrcB [Legionella sp.]|nr:MAG: fluoride efflux transporter CrcB [Legionella sp.]
MNTLLVFLGAGLGGVFRYWVSNGCYWILGRQFPYGTLIVNATGCFLMGLLFTLILERFDGLGPQLRSFLLIGFLGGYTTFSSFSLETLILFESGDWFSASLNIILSIILCILLTWLGMIIGRYL